MILIFTQRWPISSIKLFICFSTVAWAGHQTESGTDLRNMQELLGYKGSMTTAIYTNVSTN